MKEIEIKVLEVDEEDIMESVLQHDAELISDVIIHEKYYDFTDKRLTNNKEILRLRKVGDTVEFGHKRKHTQSGDYLIFDEYETVVQDFDIVDIIMMNMGLHTIIDREKRRVMFAYGELAIEIHKYPSIPAWLELEGAKEKIEDFLQKLGFTMSDTSSLTDNEILEKYGADVAYQRMEK